jgi:hypothetical protein
MGVVDTNPETRSRRKLSPAGHNDNNLGPGLIDKPVLCMSVVDTNPETRSHHKLSPVGHNDNNPGPDLIDKLVL